jgi:Zn-dependent M16 (insulinase) family peptidase
MGSIEVEPRFRRIQQFDSTFSPNTITQYESDRTGMRIVVVDQVGPKVYGYFVLATEIHDDSGAPHTLEHLCYMGSRSYKYKGFLDKLGTRAYSNINAWTATDHTAYTLESAGWAGFAQILPVYLDHLVVPLLTDSGCVTEVYHIDGEGNDAGVVYSEMQGVQNTPSELVELRGKRLIYPKEVGFRYETGGMMEQLRVLTPDRIREFHRDMYQPKNMCLVMYGEVDHKEMLKILDDFESTIMNDIPAPDKPFKRPWIDSKQAVTLTESVIEEVEFPEEDEEFGQVDIRYLGPDTADVVQSAALAVVLQYLCGSPAAVLDNNLVEKEQWASSVFFTLESRPKTEIAFSMSGVETGKLADAEKRFHAVLEEAMAAPLDMPFMTDCIERQVRSSKYTTESQTAALSDNIIADYLFGKRDGSTLEQLGSLTQYTHTLTKWTEQEWKDFITKYLVKGHYVSLLGKPSTKMSKKITEDDKARVEKRKQELGPDGLKRMADKLEQAKKENDKEIPKELLASFKVPPTESIHFVETSSARVGPALEAGKPNNRYQKLVEADGGDKCPLFINFEHIPSNFVRVHLLVSTELLAVELRPLLAIFMEAFTNLPVDRDGTTIPFDQIVVELERDTVGYSMNSASALGNVECIRITLQVEIEKYSTALNWIQELLWHSIFDISRLKSIVSRLLADIPDSKRDGNDMMTAVHNMTHLSSKSISRARSTLVQAVYLKRIKHLFNTDPDRVVYLLQSLRTHFTTFANLRFVVVSDLDRLSNPVSSFQTLLSALDEPSPLAPLGSRLTRLSNAGTNPGQLAYVVPIPAIDSSFLFACTRGISSWTDPRLPALMVAQAYLNAVEGPLWVAVRGIGLAYGVNTNYDLEGGLVSLEVYRSPDAFKAFDAARKVVSDLADGSEAFDELMLEGAVSSIVMEMANEQATLGMAALSGFVKEVIRGIGKGWDAENLKKVKKVTEEEVRRCLKEMVLPVFEAGKADVVVTCSGSGVEVSPANILSACAGARALANMYALQTIKAGLESKGFKPEVHDLAWFQDDYGLKVDDAGDGDADQDDDDDDDDDDEDGEDDEEGEGDDNESDEDASDA